MDDYENRPPIVVDGKVNLDRGAVLYHCDYGILDRNPREGGDEYAKFRIADSMDGLSVRWSADELDELWEVELFYDPIHMRRTLEGRNER